MSLPHLLDSPQPRAQLHPLSVAAYHALGELGLIPEKTELLRGFVFNKMPKSPIHRSLLLRLLELIQAAMARAPYWVQSEQPITIGNSEPEPDISVIAGRRDDFWDRHPATAEFAIEIAVTSHDLDRRKAAIYAEAGVKEFWIILVPERQIEIHRRPEGGEYSSVTVVGAEGVAVCAPLPAIQINVAALFQR
ncbi:MAG: Uma2 family endonuclease [Proteobacteria bacterium]|nr:Uma2 family endonuclease [Pseudomonadota bacterium]